MTRLRWLLLLRVAVTLAALALVARALSAEAIADALRGVRPGWVALAAAALAAQIALSALRWQRTAGALGVPLRRGPALGEYWLAVLGNTVLPGGVLGDVGRAVRLRAQAGLGAAAETVVIERLAGQLVLAFATALGVAAWFWPQPLGLGAGAGAGGLALLLWAALRKPRTLPGLPGRMLGRLLGRLRTAWVAAGIWRAQAGLSAAIVLCNLLGFWAAAQAVGVTLPPGAALFVLPLTLTAMLLPVSVNGWGLREGAAALLWPLAGVAPAAAVAASVIFGLSALIAALPGVVVPLRAARAVPAPD